MNDNLLTPHTLTGYDMVAAITQETLNYQLAQLYKKQAIHHHLDITAQSTQQQGHIKTPVTIHLVADLLAPTVELLDGSDNQRKLLFHLHMPQGRLASSLTDDLPFANWEYVFSVNLDLQAIAHDAVQNHQRIPQEVKDHLGGFTEDMFTIQHLFMDFQDADLATYDRGRTQCPLPADWGGGDLTQPGNDVALSILQGALQNHFTSLAGSDNPYILGYTVAAKQLSGQNIPPTLEPSGATFSATYNAANPKLSTLNFLIMTCGNPLPTAAGAGLFDLPWVDAPAAGGAAGTDGRFCIGKPGFFDGWLLHNLQMALCQDVPPGDYWVNGRKDRNTTQNHQTTEKKGPPLGWDLTYNAQYQWTRDNGVNCWPTRVDGRYTQNDNRSLALTLANPTPDTAQITVSGGYDLKFQLDYTCVWDGCLWTSVQQGFSGAVIFSGGTQGQLGMTNTVAAGNVNPDTGSCAGSKIDASLDVNQKILADQATGFATEIQALLNNLEAAVDGLHARFVFPAGDVFFFKNPQLDATGNLLLDVTYKM